MPRAIEDAILPALRAWTTDAPDEARRRRRQERTELAFGQGRSRWNFELVLERYELLYEAGLVAEASVEPAGRAGGGGFGSLAMAVDHRRILATALGRLRGKLKYRPVVFELMADEFTLLQLQRTVEALAGAPLHKQNFRRLIDRGGLVEGTGRRHASTGGRPAELFRFRRDVVLERAAPGVGPAPCGPPRRAPDLRERPRCAGSRGRADCARRVLRPGDATYARPGEGSVRSGWSRSGA